MKGPFEALVRAERLAKVTTTSESFLAVTVEIAEEETKRRDGIGRRKERAEAIRFILF